MSKTSSQKPSAASAPGRGPVRHVVLLGDALLEAYSSIDKTPGQFEDALLPGTRNQWKISVVSAAEAEHAGPGMVLPRDATHRVHHADADIDLTAGARRFPAPAGTTVSA